MSPLPPAILIAWCPGSGGWLATAVVDESGSPIAVQGETTSRALSPAEALDRLLGRRFGILRDEDLPATLVSIRTAPEAPLADQLLQAAE